MKEKSAPNDLYFGIIPFTDGNQTNERLPNRRHLRVRDSFDVYLTVI